MVACGRLLACARGIGLLATYRRREVKEINRRGLLLLLGVTRRDRVVSKGRLHISDLVRLQSCEVEKFVSGYGLCLDRHGLRVHSEAHQVVNALLVALLGRWAPRLIEIHGAELFDWGLRLGSRLRLALVDQAGRHGSAEERKLSLLLVLLHWGDVSRRRHHWLGRLSGS